MTLSEELQWRGQIKDKTFDDIRYLDTPKTFYLGADVGSSDSLTIGNLAIYITARRLVKAGWKAVMLVGGATSLIGDPGGKNEERELVSREQVEHNKQAIANQVTRLFAGEKFTLVDNYDWFKDIGYLEFLRDIGKHYSMTELLQRDFIAARIGEGGSGISYAEFSYSLIQGYDFWHLYNNYGVELQIGGSDQWGNMLSGVPLIRKKQSKEVNAMSIPLVINKATGKKFGKSEEGAVWLDENKTSVYRFYQFWLNVDDEGVEDYLKIYTELSKKDIEVLLEEFKQNPSDRMAQKTLAYEVTKLVHGKEKTDSVVRATSLLFGTQPLEEITEADIAMLKNELPALVVEGNSLVSDALVSSELVSSKGEARRMIEQGAIRLNGEKLDADRTCNEQDLQVAGSALLQRGKNKFAIIDIK